MFVKTLRDCHAYIQNFTTPIIDKMTVYGMSVDRMTTDSDDKMTIDEMSVVGMTVDEKSETK